MMVWNYQHPVHAQKWRENLSYIASPLIVAADAPFSLFDTVVNHFRQQTSLLNENMNLRAQVMILNGQLQKLKALENENQTLHVLLQSSAVIHHLHLTLAQVTAVQTSPYLQEILLNKGSLAGVFRGQAVLDAYGIMGQVIEVWPSNSRVLLLTDSRSGIPIQNQRTGLRGILMGEGGSGLLTWINAPITADVRKGDVLVSSGLGGNYPPAYPVGTVTRINPHTSDQFLGIQVLPRAQINSSEQVLLVWPEGKKDK
jgi:rod shape-determining protein MreC